MFHQTASAAVLLRYHIIRYLVIRKSRDLTVVPRIDLLK